LINFHPNSSGTSYSNQAWLDNHHAIKSRSRSEIILKIPLYAKDSVLDMGCGSGSWSFLAAEMVGIHGTVTGVDSNVDVLNYARQKQVLHCLRNIINFVCADIEEWNPPQEKYDAVLLFNILSYMERPQLLIEKANSSLRKGGRLIVKDTDISSDFYYPVPPLLRSEIVRISHECDIIRLKNSYNPFFARTAQMLIQDCLCRPVGCLSHAVSFSSPLTAEEKLYIRANANMLATVAIESGAEKTGLDWCALFEEGNNDSVFLRSDFMYGMTEYIFYTVRT